MTRHRLSGLTARRRGQPGPSPRDLDDHPHPSLHLDHMREVTLPAIALLILGAVGIVALLRPTATEPTG